MEIIVHTTNKTGVYQAYVGDTLLCTSRQPFFDGAREMLKLGYPAETLVNMRRGGRAYPSFLPTTLGNAARLTVIETPTLGPVLKPFRETPFSEQPQDMPFQRNGSVTEGNGSALGV
ncbi:hypothetical protein [Methylorubrum extorquens]|uniref:hypothetical protein n=1 Tax=Methylorubrum extorquens TaxID=408 RepID=UPI0005A99314|nr:hypothetical protein [Methylorubrum extorquens]KQP95283.1 hypothetical protein ASF55_16910 [Methylobacterium sp. Leaf119]WIU38769.1 hypothetical protein KQ926_19585 [Methylorubrum extorquens]